MYVVHLNPISSFVGAPPRSDTLFGALCWAMKMLYDDASLQDMLNRFRPSGDAKPDPPFLVSSAFPCVRSSERSVYFLPKPKRELTLEPPETLEEIRRRKEFGKIEWITSSLFSKITNGELPERELYARFLVQRDGMAGTGQSLVAVGTSLIHADLVKDKEHISMFTSLYRTVDVPRNAINRLSGSVDEGRFFSNQESFFSDTGGLYVLMRFFDKDWIERVFACWRFLGDRGIGADVSVGKGQFICDIQEKDIFQEPDSGARFTTLSLFFSEQSYRDVDCRYGLVRRKGKIESAYMPRDAIAGGVWKKTVLMYSEGSVFPWNGRKFYGENPVVKDMDEFQVHQYGFAFPVRMV